MPSLLLFAATACGGPDSHVAAAEERLRDSIRENADAAARAGRGYLDGQLDGVERAVNDTFGAEVLTTGRRDDDSEYVDARFRQEMTAGAGFYPSYEVTVVECFRFSPMAPEPSGPSVAVEPIDCPPGGPQPGRFPG